jgi:uncharacterized protein (TIGR03083 family)
MTLDVITYTEAITKHGAAVAAAASGHLDEPIEHCPGWTMVDLVQHLTEVQWFWATVVEQRLQERPQEGRPTDVDRLELIDRFSRGAQHLVRVLGECDQATRVYTWAPQRQDVAFVTRHQVQEIVVHHWDAAHAAGVEYQVDPEVAADSIEEFLTFSVSNDDDPIDPPGVTLGSPLGLMCTDVERSWTVLDGDAPSTVRFIEGIEVGTPRIAGTSSDILLWLYSRVELESDEESTALGGRFRGLCFTD